MLTDAQQTWVYKRIDSAGKMAMAGIFFPNKASDVCKQLKTKTSEEIDALMTAENASALKVAQAELDAVRAKVIALGGVV